MFRIGQKVVCVRGPLGNSDAPYKPKVGQIYTIREIYTDHPCPELGAALRFEELRNPMNPFHKKEYGFYACRFRPVVEKKTDISVFEEILRRESIDAPERVS